MVQDSLCLGFKSVVVEDSRCLRLKTVVKDSAEFPSWHMACHHARVLEGVVKRQFSLQDSSVWRATRARVLEGVAKGQLALQSISFKSQVRLHRCWENENDGVAQKPDPKHTPH